MKYHLILIIEDDDDNAILKFDQWDSSIRQLALKSQKYLAIYSQGKKRKNEKHNK